VSARQIPITELIAPYIRPEPKSLQELLMDVRDEAQALHREALRFAENVDWMTSHFARSNERHEYTADEDEWTA
jgi:hypothetical protein